MIKKVKSHIENIFLNANKTKIRKTDKTMRPTDIGGDLVEKVKDFDYLGSLITQNGEVNKEIRRRLRPLSATTRYIHFWAKWSY